MSEPGKDEPAEELKELTPPEPVKEVPLSLEAGSEQPEQVSEKQEPSIVEDEPKLEKKKKVKPKLKATKVEAYKGPEMKNSNEEYKQLHSMIDEWDKEFNMR